MKNFVSLVFVASLFVLFQNCSKGEPLEKTSYMRVKLEAFFPDTALFYQVRINDSLIAEVSGVNAGGPVNLVNGIKGQLPFLDSARLKVTIVKKNSANIALDSMVHFTNDNDFLLVQTNQRLKAGLINKKIAMATDRRPGKDSIYVRFFFSDEDDIRRNGALLRTIDLQIYSYRPDSLFDVNEPALRDEGRIRNVRSGEFTSYIPLRNIRDNIQRNFVFDIYPPGSSAATQPQYRRQYSEYDGYIAGDIPVGGLERGPWQTFRITKSQMSGTGKNGLLLFGFK